MKVINNTRYDTRYLRRLFLGCEKKIFATYLVHGESKYRHVTVKTHRGGMARVGGYAWYNSTNIVITLPPPTSRHLGRYVTENTVSARRIAQVYLHEVGHNLGLKHAQMKPSSKIDVLWQPDESVPLKTPKIVKPKKSIIEQRAAKAETKLAEWTKKLNRAKIFVKKYQRKVKYYQKKRAANQ